MARFSRFDIPDNSVFTFVRAANHFATNAIFQFLRCASFHAVENITFLKSNALKTKEQPTSLSTQIRKIVSAMRVPGLSELEPIEESRFQEVP